MIAFKSIKYGFVLGLLLIAAASPAAVVFAQEKTQVEQEEGAVGVATSSRQENKEASLDPNLYMGLQEAYQSNMKLRTPEAQPNELKTLFFTLWQHRLLQEFRQEGIRNRGTGANESLDAPVQKVRGIRELSLGGILFSSAESWIVWLNGQRVTPDAIPKQILDISVNEEYVELKWSDSFSNLIFPVRLRPHQRFNLDTRMFLPGSPPL